MQDKYQRAMEILNEYEYKGGKSAQEALWLLFNLEKLFIEEHSKKNINISN